MPNTSTNRNASEELILDVLCKNYYLEQETLILIESYADNQDTGAFSRFLFMYKPCLLSQIAQLTDLLRTIGEEVCRREDTFFDLLLGETRRWIPSAASVREQEYLLVIFLLQLSYYKNGNYSIANAHFYSHSRYDLTAILEAIKLSEQESQAQLTELMIAYRCA